MMALQLHILLYILVLLFLTLTSVQNEPAYILQINV